MAKDDHERLDNDAAARVYTHETGEPIRPKTMQNWRNTGRFPPGAWQWFGHTATITKGDLRRFIANRRQAQPSRRRNSAARRAAVESPAAEA
jgi:hypothetical protein